MTVDRIGIHFGLFSIHFYGVIIMCGVLLASYLAYRRARTYKEDPEKVWDILTWALIGGVIGARLWHILTPSPSFVEQGITAWYYLTHPLDAIAIWKGGLGIPGAVMGGVLAMYLYCRHAGLKFGKWLDIAAPGLALAQAVGRWGNYVNQELYGAPTTLPWAIKIDEMYRLPEFMQYATYHPLFLYESLWNIANMLFLIWVGMEYKRKLKSGDIFLTYLVVYPVGRFLLEFLRLDASQVGGININQFIMAVVALGAGWALLYRHRRTALKEGDTLSQLEGDFVEDDEDAWDEEDEAYEEDVEEAEDEDEEDDDDNGEADKKPDPKAVNPEP